ncbi:NAD(P)/FAD-dependent oxidoreductase [Curvivirga sp.]|uniref:NAD(P)/FAD-dependent oxidoreductase n=1 Tax=Curvivirga sp. TaxID=2856848 RepID=UPI003B5C0C26
MFENYVESYYSQTCVSSDYPVQEGDQSIDICVIGGGLAGLNTALGLAQRGKSVILIEANKIGWGASGRNGGFVSGGFNRDKDFLIRKIGHDNMMAMHKLDQDALNLVRERASNAEIDCQVVHGNIEGYLWDQSQTAPQELVKSNEEFGTNYEYWDIGKTQHHYKTKAYKGARFNPDAFHFHPLNYSLNIAQLAKKAGVEIYQDSPALKINDKGGQVIVETPKGKIKSNQIVLTCSGYIKNLYPKLSQATMPITTYVLVTEPLGDRLQETVTDLAYSVIDERISCDYWRPIPDRSTRILWGGRITAFPVAPHKVAEIMRKSMLRVYPHLADVKIETSWSGKMAYASHRMPMIGKINDQVWYNTGFGGHGMAATTMGGEVIARALSEGSEDYKLFQTFGLPYAGSFLGPVAAQAYYVMKYLQDEYKIWRG